MSIPVLSVRDKEGNLIAIPAIKGDKGDKGDSYTLTEADKEEIADMAKPPIDQAYNPESENPQSGIAVAEALAGFSGGSSGTWEKIVDITTTEEVNGIIATVEEFPKIAKCKEFMIRVIFQKHNGTTALQLGSSRLYLNEVLSYQINNTNVSYAAISELKAHIQFIDTLVHTIATEGLTGQAALTGGVKMLVGPRFVTEEVNEIKYLLSITTNMLPIGTQFVVYGKVEG